MVRLNDLIGKKVIIALRDSIREQDTDKGSLCDVTLHGVEAGGVWIESPDVDEIAASLVPKMKKRSVQPSQRPVLFVPYSGIVFLVAFSTRLDERDSKA